MRDGFYGQIKVPWHDKKEKKYITSKGGVIIYEGPSEEDAYKALGMNLGNVKLLVEDIKLNCYR